MRLALALLAAVATLTSTAAFADDCATAIKTMVGNAMTSGPLRMETAMTTAAGAMSMSGEIVPPGNMHVKIDTAGQVIEMITLDGKAWMNMAGTWTALDAATAAQMTAGFNMASSTAQLDLMTDMECLGTTNVEGKDLLTYSFALNQAGANTSTRVFVDPAIKAPVRIEADVDAAGTKTGMVVKYTYDPSIVITAPAM
jgi:hypothetical protein